MYLLAQIDVGNLFKDMSWAQIGVLAFVAYLFLTGKLKIADILKLLNPITPTPTPTPVDPNTPVVDLVTKILPILLPIFLKARATNNKPLEDATATLMKEAVPPSNT